MDKIKKALSSNKVDNSSDQSGNATISYSSTNGHLSTKSRRRASLAAPREILDAVESVGTTNSKVSNSPTKAPIERSRKSSLLNDLPKSDLSSQLNSTDSSSVNEAKVETGRRISLQNKSPKVSNRRFSLANFISDDKVSKTETQSVAAPIVHNTIKRLETEEIIRTKEHERHIHHVQHHIQPIPELEIHDEIHHHQRAPVTEVKENFTSTQEDAENFESLGSDLKNLIINLDGKKEVIDGGEIVEVKEYHHIHNVVQPIILRETHDRHRIHTTVPIHHVTHEAPVIHQTIRHEPLSLDEFIRIGGTLKSDATHTSIGKLLLTKPLSNLTYSEIIKPINLDDVLTADVKTQTIKNDSLNLENQK
ncbi:hypothetical protein BY996DRAFT_8691120 [Phakopsora pachyrhizi]|uniref:Uncharacterized protein n=1 Tax=Phakopsora pachyrhizi TaxID=170000 RepID=A0AAV0B0J4_PHAPC|nr:hypothetical protein BY996DRAFT_8691120 [Phakopsora pachyrhizi]CAH7674887.1 hypothetical protein PPACK8108_LOCUS9821 [Phakopsora pachyrhizi]